MRGLWIAALALVGIHVVLNLIHYEVTRLPWLLRQIFDVDEEDSIPTWFAQFILLVTAFFLLLQARRSPAGQRYYWWGLCVGFALMSLDEVAGVHETLNSIGENSWAYGGMVFAALIGGAYLSFVLSLPRWLMVRCIIGGAMYLGGALGVELWTEPYLENDELNTLAYNMWTAVEEGLEMFGVLVFLGGILRHLQSDGNTVEVEVAIGEQA